MPSRLRALFALPFAALALAAPHPSVAARLATPTPVAPAPGAVSESLPVFGWNKVTGADRYEFQVAADSGFNSPVIGAGEDHFVTRNTRATLKKTIPNGTYYWRVRAVTKAGGVSAWTTPQSFKHTWTAAASLQAPTAGAGLSFPGDALRMTWSGVPYAASYLVSVATEPTLSSLVLHDTGSTSAVSTAATSLTSPAMLAPGSYFWSVTPVDARGNKGAASPVASFSWAWPSTTTPTVQDVVAAPEVFDPQFSWTPVAGAARYEVEVNTTADFATGSKVCCSGSTIATTASPTTLLKDNVFYWRVRAIDADGNAGVWNAGPTFTKAFDKVPPVTAPSIKNVRMVDTSGATQAGPGYTTSVPIIRWDPVPGASSYQVDVADSCNWTGSPLHRWSVVTATTAWTPLGHGWNNQKPHPDAHAMAYDMAFLEAGHSYCARVRARSDRDSAMGDIYGDYACVASCGTAFIWSGPPTADPCAAPCNPAASDYLMPQSGSTTARMPLFTWKPLDGRQSYFVLVAKDASFSNIVDYAFTQLPAYAPRSILTPTTYPDEATSYYWAVLPATDIDGGNALVDLLLANPQSFLKASAPPSLVTPAEGSTITGQPTFQWTQAEAARNYRLQVAQDPTFGTPLEDTTTAATTFTPTGTYPADTVLYWRVRANDENLVGLPWSATGTFRRSLPAPVPSATNPATGDFIPTWTWSTVSGAVSYDVSVDLPDGTHKDLTGIRMPAITATKMSGTGLFHWRVRANFPKSTAGAVVPGPFSGDMAFTRTIGEPSGAHSELTKDRLVLSWESKTGAKEYRVQVSSTPDFGTVQEDVTTDNTAYAPLLTQPVYTTGGTLYWRVAAVDAERNQGDYSPAQKIGLAKQICQAEKISRSMLYRAWSEGWGPKFYRVGVTRRITYRARLEWQREREAAAAAAEEAET